MSEGSKRAQSVVDFAQKQKDETSWYQRMPVKQTRSVCKEDLLKEKSK
jgi:hypothetical protein